MDILIPSLKPRKQLNLLIDSIEKTVENPNIITSGFRVSAATNRNYCLNRATSDIVIMMDDDMDGFYKGWAETLIKPLKNPEILMVSARLLNVDGGPGVMVGENYDLIPGLVEIGQKQLPTACIAFYNRKVRFNENFIGSGFEDNRFCLMLGMSCPTGKFVINNDCQLVHLNERKNQGGEFWNQNQKYFKSILGKTIKVGEYVA